MASTVSDFDSMPRAGLALAQRQPRQRDRVVLLVRIELRLLLGSFAISPF
jgi:hypothetical protein